jgi:hypothetical protein
MTIKYLFSADNIDPDLDFFMVAHIPIDSVIMKNAKKVLGVNPLSNSWSDTDNYKEILDYQVSLRSKLRKDEFPLLWEIENWKP